ncbi:MAG: hypothetical protein BroJett011_54840 [Chloroflexota bacterium]|nr:MAG: hypothetical protein BroJett011_54840 [Chloroflexota bacterium]
MPETIGTLELKIARLEQRLAVIRQQQRLSQPYPEHRAALLSEDRHLQTVLSQLNRRRQEVLPAQRTA